LPLLPAHYRYKCITLFFIHSFSERLIRLSCSLRTTGKADCLTLSSHRNEKQKYFSRIYFAFTQSSRWRFTYMPESEPASNEIVAQLPATTRGSLTCDPPKLLIFQKE